MTACPRVSGAKTDDLTGDPLALSRKLIAWYELHKRDLPWRQTSDPYAVWISEAMLQQTQVATVMGYWTRWLERFPTPTALADAPLDDVLKRWQGLGYYARARNLHKAAKLIRDELGGKFPTTYEGVLALPGVGRYTAGAVCSIALGLDVPLVDANVIRVLGRVFALPGDPKSLGVQDALWEKAGALIPPGEAGTFNQAMMELGALVCGARPKCDACPLSADCRALALGDPLAYPEFAPKKTFTRQTDVCAVIYNAEGRLLLTRRAPDGLWGGLWELPRVTLSEGEGAEEAASRAAREIAGLTAVPGETLARVKHGVMQKKITLLGLACDAPNPERAEPLGCAAVEWTTLEGTLAYPLSSPQARLIEKLLEAENGEQLALF